MAKKKKEEAPQVNYTNSIYRLGGQDVARSYYDGNGNIINEVIETPAQQAFRQKGEAMLNEYISKLDTLSPEYVANRNNQLEALKAEGTEIIKDVYNPMVHNLKNDVNSRFGTLNSSSFLDELNKIEENRTKSVKELANQLIIQKNNFDNDEFSKNMGVINMLLGSQNNSTQNALSNFSSAKVNYTTSEEEDKGLFSVESLIPYSIRSLL